MAWGEFGMIETKSLFTHEQNIIDEIKNHFKEKKNYRVLSNLFVYDKQSNL